MEFAINPEENFPSSEIRRLSEVEIDCVEGGVYSGLSKTAETIVNLVIRLTGGVH